MNILDIAFFQERNISDPGGILKKHAGNWEHYKEIASTHKVHLIKFANFQFRKKDKGLHFYFMPMSGFRQIKSILKETQPQIIITHSFNFPIRTLLLLYLKSADSKIIVQHHGDRPRRHPIWLFFQRLTYTKIDAAFFVNREQAQAFKDKSILKKNLAIYEITEGSSFFQRNQDVKRENKPMRFVWVARLNVLKDPFCVLEAFKKYKALGHDFLLDMYYSDAPLESEIKKFIQNHSLTQCVLLKGKVEHSEIENILNVADYFVSASRYEAGGYAFTEALACGCVPIITEIPSHKKMLGTEQNGYLFSPGNVEGLLHILMQLNEKDRMRKSDACIQQFHSQLSIAAIARNTIIAFNKISND